MALRHLGQEQTQSTLNHLLGLTSIGTPYSTIRRMETLGVNVALRTRTSNELQAAIDAGLPVIVFVMTGDLPYWHDNTSHAVLVVGYDDASIMLNDPAFEQAPQPVAWADFMLAWSEHDFMCAIVS
jgi:ABC-type bacteriocin/lantibiotic exporter with double-glycine peptidase domain